MWPWKSINLVFEFSNEVEEILAMEVTQLISFSLISIGFIMIPGPNVLVIVSTSLHAGKLRGLQTVMGTSLAMVVQLFIAALGTSWLLSVVSEGLFWLKWLGVAYLIILGIRALRNFYQRKRIAKPSAMGSFHRGFWISLTNPKTILFFSAFLPQFVTSDALYLQQVAILSACFWLLAVFVDSSYAMLAARSRWLLQSQKLDPHATDRFHNGLSAALYLGAGTLLAGRTL